MPLSSQLQKQSLTPHEINITPLQNGTLVCKVANFTEKISIVQAVSRSATLIFCAY